jgi:multiple sugar transport system substrate-binding protein
MRTYLVLVGALVAGCAPKGPAKIELRYMAWGNPEQLALEQRFCNEFNAQNPDLHVRFVMVPGSAYVNKAVVMFASRTAPDLVRIDHYNFPNFVRKHYFLDLSKLAAADPGFHAADFFPQAIEEATYKGGFYGLNQGFGAEVIYYNKTMVKGAGLEDPYALYLRGEWTWDRYRQYAIAMTKRDESGRVTQFGCAVPQFPMNLPVIWAFGGDLLTPDQMHSRLAEPGTVRSYEFLHNLRWVDHCAPTPAQAANSAYTFESGTLGMSLNWMGMAPRYREAAHGFEWDICPMPKGPFGGASILKGNQLTINRETPHPEAAWRFERFITSAEVETEFYAIRRRNFPTRIAVANSREFLSTKLPPFNTRAYLQDVETARPMPIGPRWAEWTRLATNAEEILYASPDPNVGKVLSAAAKKIDALLAEEEGF